MVSNGEARKSITILIDDLIVVGLVYLIVGSMKLFSQKFEVTCYV